MKKPLYISVLFLFNLGACNQHGAKNNSASEAAKKIHFIDSVKKHADSITAIMRHEHGLAEQNPLAFEDTALVFKKIPYNLYSFHPLTLGEPFSVDSALAKLFPGHYYKLWRNDSDSIVFEAWSSKLTPKHTFFGWASDSAGDVFPFADSNETQVGDTSLSIASGKRNIVISFNNTFLEDDFMGMGRLTSAFMGLALFTEENNKWVLKAFNPAIGYYGMFQQIPRVHTFKFNSNNIGCYIGNTTGGSGGPYFTEGYVFAVIGNTFKIVLHRDGVEREDTPRNTWYADQEIDSSQLNKQFPDILITTYGDYRKADFDSTYGDDTSSALAAIKPLILTHKNDFDFTIKSRYTFTGEAYKLLKEDVTTSPHDDSKDDKNFKYSW